MVALPLYLFCVPGWLASSGDLGDGGGVGVGRSSSSTARVTGTDLGALTAAVEIGGSDAGVLLASGAANKVG